MDKKYKRIELHGVTHKGEVEVYKCANRLELDRLTLKLFDRFKVFRQLILK